MPPTTDPRTSEPLAEDLPQERQDYPGSDASMTRSPDHGEESYRGHAKLAGRKALITGGDSGIGRAVALAYAREGADVAFTYLPDERQDAELTVQLVQDAGQRAVALVADLRDEQVARDTVDTAAQALGGLDLLVSNAAYQMAQPDGLAAITTEQLDRTMRTNVYAMVWVVQQALKHLGPGSTIVCTSSIQAFQPSPGLLDYAMTKSAILTFVRGLALQLGPSGIRVNAVCPGPVWTPLIPATMDEEKVEHFGEDTPLGRPAQPAEMASAFVYLASEDSSYVTGDRILATGGRLS